MRRAACIVTAVATTFGCATTKPVTREAAEPVSTTRCWVGQLTNIDASGYRVASVPMLLRVQRRPDAHRMTRDLALGEPATLQQDVFYVANDGALSFVESDLRAEGYEARGVIAGDPWASDEMSLDLVLPEASVRVREWRDDGVLYGHYRYRDEDGQYGEERFHALSPLDGRECADRIELARQGSGQPAPTAASWAEEVVTTPEEVDLSFAWPNNLDASIRLRRTSNGTPPSPPSVDATYQLRTWPDDEGARVEVRSRELLAVPQHTLEDEKRWERARVLASLFPAVQVGFDGQITALAEPDDYLETVRTAFLERWAGGADSDDEEAHEYLDANLSPDLAVLSAQRYWNPLVAFWAGATLKVGETERAHLRRALWFPGAVRAVEVEVPVEYRFEGWVRCTPEAGEAACVKLTTTYRVTEHDVRMPLADAGPDGRPIRVMKHLDETNGVLIAEPTTLLPHHYFEERVLESFSGGADETRQVQRRETMDLTFTYR